MRRYLAVLAALSAFWLLPAASQSAIDTKGTVVTGIDARQLMGALGVTFSNASLYNAGWTLCPADQHGTVSSLTISVFGDAKQARARFDEACLYMAVGPTPFDRKLGDSAKLWVSITGVRGTINLVRDNVAVTISYGCDPESALDLAQILDNSIICGANGVRRGTSVSPVDIGNLPDRIPAVPNRKVTLRPTPSGFGSAKLETMGFYPRGSQMRAGRDGELTFTTSAEYNPEQVRAGMERARVVVGCRDDLRVVIKDIPLALDE